MLDAVACIVDARDIRGKQSHYDAHCGAERDGEENQLSVLVHCALKLARAEKLTHHDGDGGAHGEEGAEKEV